MRLLVDTQIVLWQLAGIRDVGDRARQAVRDASGLSFSAVSYAEIGVKVSIGKLEVPGDFAAQVEAMGLRTLSLTAAHGLAVADLPVHHRDPFDRLLIAQAIVEEMAVVTADRRFADARTRPGSAERFRLIPRADRRRRTAPARRRLRS